MLSYIHNSTAILHHFSPTHPTLHFGGLASDIYTNVPFTLHLCVWGNKGVHYLLLRLSCLDGKSVVSRVVYQWSVLPCVHCFSSTIINHSNGLSLEKKSCDDWLLTL